MLPRRFGRRHVAEDGAGGPGRGNSRCVRTTPPCEPLQEPERIRRHWILNAAERIVDGFSSNAGERGRQVERPQSAREGTAVSRFRSGKIARN